MLYSLIPSVMRKNGRRNFIKNSNASPALSENIK